MTFSYLEKQALIKKILSLSTLFLILTSLVGISFVQAEEITGTGIDWQASTMKVNFRKEVPAVPDSTCFSTFNTTPCISSELGYSCIIADLKTLGYSEANTAPIINDCYKEAGFYKVQIDLTDFAGNTASMNTHFRVKAASPDKIQSEFKLGAGCSEAVANGSDICNVTLVVKDRYRNPVTQLTGSDISLYSPNTFPLDANMATTFREAITLNGNPLGTVDDKNKFTLVYAENVGVLKRLKLSSIVPTLESVGAYLAKVVPFQIDFKMELPQIGADGNIDTTLNPIVFEYGAYSPKIPFKPMVNNNILLPNGQRQFLVGETKPITIKRVFTKTSDAISPVFESIYHYGLPDELVFTKSFFANTQDGKGPIWFLEKANPGETNRSSAETSPKNTIAMLGLKEASFDDGGDKLSFYSVIKYFLEGREIRYPGAAIGAGFGAACTPEANCDSEPLTIEMIGASIEGSILGKEANLVFVDQTLDSSTLLGESTFRDIRANLFQNAHSIIRSLKARPAGFLKNTWFNNRDVVFVEGDVTIDSTFTVPSGKKTLVIKNGNLIIDSDMYYPSVTDSLGVILINDSIAPFPEKGNLFIRSNVKHVVGAFFLEGGLMTNDAADPTIYNYRQPETLLNEEKFQLLLEGTLLSHNTLGGGYTAFIGNVTDNYVTPWGRVNDLVAKGDKGYEAWKVRGFDDLKIAKAYDLHMVRRYIPTYDENGVQTNTDKCVTKNGVCDSNRRAFVVRYDGRVKQFSPPGFESLTSIIR